MAELLQIANFDDINIVETAELAADALAGQPIATFFTSQNIVANDLVLLGELGREGGEIATVLSVSGESVTFSSNLKYQHNKFSPATKLFGSQIKVYRATNTNDYAPDDSLFSIIGSATNIDPDQLFTSFTDGSGGTLYWYKTTYFNPVTSDETSLTQAIAVRGGGYGNLVSIEDIKHEAGLENNPYVSDEDIAVRRSQAQSMVMGTLYSAGYQLPLKDANGNLYTPDIVVLATLSIAAGLILEKDWGPQAGDAADQTKKTGTGKRKRGQDILTQISNATIVLLDINNQPLSKTSDNLSGWPDETTADVGTSGVGEPYAVTMDKVF